MFRRKLNKRLRCGLPFIDGRPLVSEASDVLDINTPTVFISSFISHNLNVYCYTHHHNK
jgi:hypothetical protein